ncbi:octanoyl-[GcvH]:protein N-octanoyltransferase [Enterococcus sp. PF1-24]|uniref:lipoate--protein ligase family protein n=1 Tax=unclassified Enterococcus TaxID=2608891 RepID=UPI00247670E8|nr:MULTISPECIES: lipoate--protein ligase family protein [unclassified Enterococcus]MDH6364775.1 octanoyl-[GcvH]:protein N-octanoyltransferase [Enterococcus sp. PFB1-1]MDH6401880.1 octanoyl-[GcvH]:protein N-octanoyltransferase [Enterococcus sp. PF1-24]
MKSTLLVLDQKMLPSEDKYLPFAVTDFLIETASQNEQAFLHFWQLPQTFILGMKDTRVPNFTAGLAYLKKENIQPLIRNSGGLGVIADAGILNISLILPTDSAKKLSIEVAYQLMVAVVKQAFSAEIIPQLVADSYCPGSYDLTLQQLKFAGLAQRRLKNGVAIMIYLSLSGPQQQRGLLVKNFYQETLKEQFGADGYPAVNPASMANLSELLAKEITVASAKDSLMTAAMQLLATTSQATTLANLLNDSVAEELLQKKILQMQQRNNLLL